MSIRRLPAVLLGTGLVALVGLTTYAVAAVSFWLAPAYLALMILIFAAPGARGVKSTAAEPTTGPSDASIAPPDEDTILDRAGERGPSPLAGDPTSDVPIGEAAGASTTRVDPAGPLLTKPRRSRSRSRKAAKLAAEPAADSSPATWIRVGPGQFVRADSRIPEATQATAEPVTLEADPATDRPTTVAHDPEVGPDANPTIDGPSAVLSAPPTADAFEVPEDSISQAAPEVAPAPECEQTDSPTVENGPEPSDEEYGIAPSAFVAESGDSPPSPSLVPVVSGGLVLPEAASVRIDDHDGSPSVGEFAPERPGSTRPRSWTRTAFLPRGIANASPGRRSIAVSSRRGRRTPPGARIPRGRRSSPDLRLRQAARSARGRTAHVQRDRRPRSPPRHAA